MPHAAPRICPVCGAPGEHDCPGPRPAPVTRTGGRMAELVVLPGDDAAAAARALAGLDGLRTAELREEVTGISALAVPDALRTEDSRW